MKPVFLGSEQQEIKHQTKRLYASAYKESTGQILNSRAYTLIWRFVALPTTSLIKNNIENVLKRKIGADKL
jgi:hypothetical protein